MKQRRKVLVRDLFIYFWLQLAVLIIFWTAYGLIVGLTDLPVWAVTLVTVVLSYLPLKYFIIGSVLMYKAYAPMSMRDECRFIPTCSTYMIIAVRKYGIIIGVIKGIRRICRCKPPNGGIDYP